jgi:hypothetical protein
MTDRALPSEEFAKCIIEMLSDTPLAADERELGRLVRLPLREQFAVALLVKVGEAETVQGALGSMAEREGAHARALERRSRFGVVGDLKASSHGGLEIIPAS